MRFESEDAQAKHKAPFSQPLSLPALVFELPPAGAGPHLGRVSTLEAM